MDDTALKSEITSDPAHLDYAASVALGDDAAVAALLNDPSKGGTINRGVAWSDLAIWGAASGVRAAVEAAKTSTDASVRAIVLTYLDAVAAKLTPTFAVGNASIAALLGQLVTANVMTSQQQAALVALGVSPCSRAEALFGAGTVVSHLDVARALRGT